MGRTDVLKSAAHKDGRHQQLDRAELPIDTASLARYLIGKVLVRELPEGVATGRIVETEAYIVGDAAGHAYRGTTRRNRSLFLEGIPIMRLNRGIARLHDLARRPGRLAAALRVDRSLDGLDLCRKSPLWLGHGDEGAVELGQSVRVGISRDKDRLLRFYLRHSPFVSGPRSPDE
jgi:DNA-3-methyladenine glycosylase